MKRSLYRTPRGVGKNILWREMISLRRNVTNWLWHLHNTRENSVTVCFLFPPICWNMIWTWLMSEAKVLSAFILNVTFLFEPLSLCDNGDKGLWFNLGTASSADWVYPWPIQEIQKRENNFLSKSMRPSILMRCCFDVICLLGFYSPFVWTAIIVWQRWQRCMVQPRQQNDSIHDLSKRYKNAKTTSYRSRCDHRLWCDVVLTSYVCWVFIARLFKSLSLCDNGDKDVWFNLGSTSSDEWLYPWSTYRRYKNAKTTPYQSRCDVMTSHRLWFDVVLTLSVCWVSIAHCWITNIVWQRWCLVQPRFSIISRKALSLTYFQDIDYFPGDTKRKNYVVSKSMRRNDFASAMIRRCFDVIYLLGFYSLFVWSLS